MMYQEVGAWNVKAGQSSRHLADQCHTVLAKIEESRRQQAPDHEYEGAGDTWRDHAQPEDNQERGPADEHGQRVDIAQRAEPGPELLKRVGAGRLRTSQLRKLTDDDVDRRSEEEPSHDCPREELRYPPHL